MLLLFGCVSRSWVVAGRGHQGLRALETAQKRTGVYGDVPLPWVDVGRPGGGNLGVDAEGGRRGRSGVDRVTTMTPTATGVLLVLPFLPVPPLLGERDEGAGVGAGGLAAAGAG
jgi:hypothetical protein